MTMINIVSISYLDWTSKFT